MPQLDAHLLGFSRTPPPPSPPPHKQPGTKGQQRSCSCSAYGDARYAPTRQTSTTTCSRAQSGPLEPLGRGCATRCMGRSLQLDPAVVAGRHAPAEVTGTPALWVLASAHFTSGRQMFDALMDTNVVFPTAHTTYRSVPPLHPLCACSTPQEAGPCMLLLPACHAVRV